MRQILSLAMVLVMVTQFAPATFAGETVKSQITAMPTGTNIEIQLNSKQTLRGARGEASDSGFTLSEPGTGNRLIAFDDVASVKLLGKKSHTTRNVLIVAGIALLVVVAVVAVHAENSPKINY